ncbi:MAG: DUF5724 domain-containing protein, partial [Acidimicrobiia bacterium]
MINAEEAKARLSSMARPGWREDALRRVSRLPRSLRPIATTVLETVATTHRPGLDAEYQRRLEEAGAAIDRLSDKDRLALMSTLAPRLGVVLSRWWVDAIGQPYLSGWARRAFRAPQSPSISLPARSQGLRQLVWYVGPFEPDAAWVAAWAPHIPATPGSYTSMFGHMLAGPLLSAAIDVGGPDGEQVLRTLIDVGNGDHPVGSMGRHVIVGLLGSSRIEGWEFIERLLLAAQRQEGLRQSILESVDEAHPQAFTRMLDFVVEHDLLRFAAAVRAAGVWLGVEGDVEVTPQIARRLASLSLYRRDPDVCRAALTDGDAWETYLALFAVAMHDVIPALEWAEVVMRRPTADVRAAAVRFLATTQLTSATARVLGALDDPSLEVAALANTFLYFGSRDAIHPPDAFERLERFAHRLPPGNRTGEVVGIETSGPSLARDSVLGKMLSVRGPRPLGRLVPWISDMEPHTRSLFAEAAGESKRLSADVREVLVRLVGDRSGQVRAAAVKALNALSLDPAEAIVIEDLLTRKAGDLRRGVIGLLARQSAPNAVASARRLWAGGDPARRDAACELLGSLPPGTAGVGEAIAELVAQGLTDRQRELLRIENSDIAGGDGEVAPSPLFDRARMTAARAPRPAARGRVFGSVAAARVVSALDDLAHEHRDREVTIVDWQGSTKMLLADVRWLPSPFGGGPVSDGGADTGTMVLPEVFHHWWENRPPECREIDALDAARSLVLVESGARVAPYGAKNAEWWSPALRQLIGHDRGELRHRTLVAHVLEWLVAESADADVIDECIDGYEALLARVPEAVIAGTPLLLPDDANRFVYRFDWRHVVLQCSWHSMLHGLVVRRPEAFNSAQLSRMMGLARWIDEPVPGATRIAVPSALLLAAAQAGVASDDDIRDGLLEPGTQLLSHFTRRRSHSASSASPRVAAVAAETRDRIVEMERKRGDLPTPASRAAKSISSISGGELAIDLLGRLGKGSIARGYASGVGRAEVYSHLIRVSFPSDADTGSTVRAAALAAKVSDKRLVEFAVFAPQWARVVGDALRWDGFDDAVWWFHAHTKDDQWGVGIDVRETWAALSAERTPLSGQDLLAGAVDYAWFQRAYARLGAKRWATLHAAAKLASGGAGHRRAQLFAEAIVGETDESALRTRISTTRHQDSVRALGLVPLPGDEPDRAAVTLGRYQALREFERGSAKFGNQRQLSERTAVRIGIENLARSAGFDDPQRFIWSMEAAELGDLADGPVTVEAGNVAVTLSIDDRGEANLAVVKSGKPLKAIPADLRKMPEIAELRDRKTTLVRQASRVRTSLESAMVRGERFTLHDLSLLDRHPIVEPLLRRLVFVDEGGVVMRRVN